MSPAIANPALSLSPIAVSNPRTGETLYSIPEPTTAEIKQAYETARAAFKTVRTMSVRTRVGEIGKLKQYILGAKERIAGRIVEETGKCLTDAMMLDIFPVLDMIAYYEKSAGAILADQKVKTPLLLFGRKSRVFYEPIGPVLIISPWNYPFNLTLIPAICAFLAGNSVILKPSERTPLKGVIEEIVSDSGFVKDAIQVVYAGPETAGLLIEEKPAKVFFTGSVAVGKKVMARAAKHLIPVELELGGKDAMIVFDDVDMERAVNGALWGGMVNSGQTCFAVERLYVQEGIYEEFLRLLIEKTGKIRTLSSPEGREDERELDVGCMTAEFQIAKIEKQIAEAIEKGARVLTGGSRESDSRVFPPTIVVDVDPTMSIQREETFGPVLTVTKFKTEEEAIRLANDSPYGLGASVWTADRDRAERVARQIVTGNVSINNVMAFAANPALPYGGIKDSGFGRYKGPHGLHGFSNVKSVVIDRHDRVIEPNWYPYSKEKYGLFTKMIDAFFRSGLSNLGRMLECGMKLSRLIRRKRL